MDTLTKCSIKDNPCMMNSFMKVLSEVGSTGIPELNILPLDPLELKNVTIIIMDSLELTLTDGTIKGLKNCKVNKFRYAKSIVYPHTRIFFFYISFKIITKFMLI